MPSIKVGLANGKTSYFDKLTNTYITLDNPVQVIHFDDKTDLSKITHALLATVPALILYEGNIPQVDIDKWKKKYDKFMHSVVTKDLVVNGQKLQTLPIKSELNGKILTPNNAGDRADRLNAGSADVVAENVGEPEEVTLEAKEVKVAEVEKKAAPKKKTAASK